MTTTIDYVTKPLFATVGAGGALYAAAVEAFSQVRHIAGTVPTDGEKLRERVAKLPADAAGQFAELRERLARPDVPKDLTELRARLAPEELRKTADTYVKSALGYYGGLANRGEQTVGRLRADDRVARAEGKVTDAVAKISDLVAGVKAEDVPVEYVFADEKPAKAKKIKKFDVEGEE